VVFTGSKADSEAKSLVFARNLADFQRYLW